MAFQSNSNNAWIFNGNNGNVNNGNNRINAYYGRGFRDSCSDDLHEVFLNAVVPLPELYFWYFYGRRGKRKSRAQLEYELEYIDHIFSLFWDFYFSEYIPGPCKAFMLHYPCLREVIAPRYPDRPPQTMWCETIRPYVEKVLDPDSYSCRVGRGALRAVERLVELYYEESLGGQEPCVWFRIDQRSYFLHISKAGMVEQYRPIIEEAWVDNPAKRDFMLWLCRILYESDTISRAVRLCPRWEWDPLPAHKSRFNLPPDQGVDIGNLIAQIAGNLKAVRYLAPFNEYGYRKVHYTDDIIGPLRVSRLRQFLHFFIPHLRTVEAAEGLELNEGKTVIRKAHQGICAFGYYIKVRPDGTAYVVPSKRIVHNALWKIEYHLERGRFDRGYRIRNKEHFRDCINSYYGIFKHCCSYELREEIGEMILCSAWAEQLEFLPDYRHSRIRRCWTKKAYYTHKNKQIIKNLSFSYGNTTANQRACSA